MLALLKLLFKVTCGRTVHARLRLQGSLIDYQRQKHYSNSFRTVSYYSFIHSYYHFFTLRLARKYTRSLLLGKILACFHSLSFSLAGLYGALQHGALFHSLRRDGDTLVE